MIKPEPPITPAQTDAMPKFAEIPPAGSEERDFWLEAAEQHGFVEWTETRRTYHGSEEAILKLMSEARKQGQRDALESLVSLSEIRPYERAINREFPIPDLYQDRPAWAVTALELADSFEGSGKSLFFPDQYPPGYPQGWKDAHDICARDLRDLIRDRPSTLNDEAGIKPASQLSTPNDE